jgi:hypothetical protein
MRILKLVNVLTETICTKEHPFNVKGRGFVEAALLKEGNIIYSVSSGNEFNRIRMRLNNPMKDKAVVNKVHKNLKEQRKNGTLVPYERDEEWRNNQSKRMQTNNPMYNSENVLKMLKNKVYPKSGLERRLHRILNTVVKVNYCGGGSLPIGDEKSGFMCPDFIVPGTMKVFEVYDPTFKMYSRSTPAEQEAYECSRRSHYKKFGFKVFFVKPDDVDWYIGQGSGKPRLLNRSMRKQWMEKVGKFIHNGAEVISVERVSKRRWKGILKKQG